MTRIEDLHDQTMLNTGASSAIGVAAARIFAPQDARLALSFNGLPDYIAGNLFHVNGGMFPP